MPNSLPQLTPELIEVLRDIERDERASLFVTTPERFLRGLRGIGGSLDQSHITRSHPEQHLIRVHGAEMARAIRFWVYDWLWTANPDDASPRVDNSTGARAYSLEELTRPQPNAPHREQSSLIRQLTGLETSPKATPSRAPELELLAIARLLDPHPQTDQYLAEALACRGQHYTSARVALATLDRGPAEGLQRSSTALSAGNALLLTARPTEGASLFTTAIQALEHSATGIRDTSSILPAIGLLVSTMVTHDTRGMEHAAAALKSTASGLAEPHMAPIARQYTRSTLGPTLNAHLLESRIQVPRSVSQGPLQVFLDALDH